MSYTFEPMSEAEAQEIVSWRYESPYDFYDVANDPEQEVEITDPVYRMRHYYSARDEAGNLVGFFEYKARGDELYVGLGLRPDLTGKGLGRDFVEAGLEFGRQLHSPTHFTLEVAKFNERATKIYEKCGFVIVGESTHRQQDQDWPFHEMSRPA